MNVIIPSSERHVHRSSSPADVGVMTMFDHVQWLFLVTISTTSLTVWAQPSAPASFMITNVGSSTLEFSWTAITGMNVVSYTLTATSAGEATVTDTFTGESTGSGSLSGLVQFTAYSVDLVATNNTGTSSTATTVMAATLLSAPGSFRLTARTSTSITFSWSAPNSGTGVQSYSISVDGGTAMDVGLVTSHTLMSLTPNTQYSLTIRAVDNMGNRDGNESAAISVTTQLTAPTAIRGTPQTSSTASLSWTAPSNTGVQSYSVTITPVGGGASMTATLSGTTASFSGLTPFTTYLVEVVAVSATTGNGEMGTGSFTTLLAAPASLQTTTVGSTSLALSWTAPSGSGVQGYEVTVSPPRGSSAQRSPTGTSTTLTGLDQFTTYTVTVFAIDTMSRSGDPSTSITPRTLLASPGNFRLTARTSTSITLSWSAPNSGTGVQSYSVSVDGGTAMPVGSGTSHTLMSLTPNTQYSLTIRAVDNMGSRDGDQSSISVTTRLSAPTSVATTPAITSIQVTVTPPSGSVSGYRVTVNSGAPTTESAAFTISALMPATLYTITIAAIASGTGLVGDSAPFSATTNPAVPPSSPTSLVGTASGSSVTLTWQQPVAIGDVSVNYIVTYQEAQVAKTTSMLTIIISSLLPNTAYTFIVTANNTAGMSGSATFTISTLDLPSAVSSVTAEPVSTASVRFSWTAAAPPPPPGVVDGYQLTVVTLGANANTTAPPVNAAANLLQTTIASLVAGTPYFVELRVSETVRGLGVSRASAVFFSAELAADPTAQVSSLVLNTQAGTRTLTWVPVHLFQARHFFNYTIEYVPASGGTQKRQTMISNILPYSACTSTQCSSTVPALDKNFNYTATIGITRSTLGVSITILAMPSVPTTADPPTTIIIIVVVLVGVVLVALLGLVLFILCFCCLCSSSGDRYGIDNGRTALVVFNRNKRGDTLDSTDSGPLVLDAETIEKVKEHTRTILLEDFPNYVKDMHKDRDAGFEEEYKLFRTDLVAKASVAQEQLHKNRYGNIFAYDHSRVVLKEPDSEGVDYINASFIEGYQHPKRYIAAQGPIEETIGDFWHMLWEQRSPVIIMLTRIEEGGRKKCELYWPEEKGEPLTTERGLKVTLVALQHFADFEIREFHITSTKNPDVPLLEVKHFLYTVWPDHGVPQYATSVIKFIRRVRKSFPMAPDSNPMLVHCSAGVGRSGTFICLDTMLQRMTAESNFNVFEFVTAMRNNRTFMVQTLDQYIFIHDAIEELIVCGDTSIPASNMRIKVNKLHKQMPGKTQTVFEYQFELLQSVSHSPTSAEISEALMEQNKSKNRDQKYIPYNLARPRLLSMGIHNGADYINASYVDAYKESNYFVLTQSPLHSTMKEFWLTVWQIKTACVVMLCNTEEGEVNSTVQFWPTAVKEKSTYGQIEVTFQSEEIGDTVTTRKFQISMEGRDAPPNTVTLLQHAWPEEGCPTDHKPLLEVIHAVVKIQQMTGNNPIVVLCPDGSGRSGAFTQIVSQIERMKVESTVDFFQGIKLARLQRPHLVDSLDVYIFCHEFLLSYLDSFEGYSNFEKPAPK